MTSIPGTATRTIAPDSIVSGPDALFVGLSDQVRKSGPPGACMVALVLWLP